MLDFEKTLTSYVDRNEQELIGRLAELIRKPSVSSSGEGVS